MSREPAPLAATPLPSPAPSGGPSTPPGPPPASVGHGARAAALARRGLPWLVAAFCLAYAFEVVPFRQCLAALREARIELFFPLATSAVVLWFLLESAAYARLFSRLNAPLSGRDARSLRALTYLLTVIHWHVAKAAVVLRLQATHGVGLMAGTSTLLLYQMLGIVILAAFAGAGALLAPAMPGSREVAGAAFALAAGTSGVLGLLRSDRPRLALLDELRALPLFASHRRVALEDVVAIGLLKTAYQLVFVLVYYFGLRAFGLAPSFFHVLVGTALLQAVGSLPISPAGLGTQQAAMLFLFSDPAAKGADGPALLAFAFTLPITTMTLRALLACLYLGDLARPSSGPAESTSASRSATTRV
ncbi:MAG: lysylphosphatidylglycerol synthase domain-containing protein [Myxococcota bacterium]